jgi:hypothetical protein
MLHACNTLSALLIGHGIQVQWERLWKSRSPGHLGMELEQVKKLYSASSTLTIRKKRKRAKINLRRSYPRIPGNTQETLEALDKS